MGDGTAAHERESILVVDDTPANLQVLAGMLKEKGYRVRPVLSGALALQSAAHDPPDLILLDIMMPEIDGYEVCRRLKESEATRDIPVIFLSALNDTADKVKAFRLGGVDYVTKPFQLEEVQSRVEAHLCIRRFRLELERKNRSLEESYRKLHALEEVRDSLTHMMAHDMRNALMGITGYLEVVTMTEARNLSGDGKKRIAQAGSATATLNEMISAMLDVSRMEAGQMPLSMVACDPYVLAEEVAAQTEPLRRQKKVVIEKPAEALVLNADRGLFSRILLNLVANALKFTPSDGGEVHVRFEKLDNGVHISVEDNGRGIAPEDQGIIFQKFAQARLSQGEHKYSTGLGLTFCKLAVEAHGGRIWVVSEMGKGSTFHFVLPREKGTASALQA